MAIDLILRSQKIQKKNQAQQGGWRYSPDSKDADLSVTIWQLMALRSAKTLDSMFHPLPSRKRLR